MDSILKLLYRMSDEQLDGFYKALKEKGVDDEDIETLHAMVFFHRLFSDTRFYNSVQEAMAEVVYEELKNS